MIGDWSMHESGINPRVGAQHRENDRLRSENMHLIEDRDRLYSALQKIAGMPTEPRPDGTYNYSRAALIDIARKAIDSE